MTSLRSIALALLVALLGGPALLDPCLFDCHESAVTKTAVPSCHDVATHDGLSLAGTAACDHDHDAMSADGVVDLRAAISVPCLAPASMSRTEGVVERQTSTSTWFCTTSPPSSAGRALHLPLRL